MQNAGKRRLWLKGAGVEQAERSDGLARYPLLFAIFGNTSVRERPALILIDRCRCKAAWTLPGPAGRSISAGSRPASCLRLSSGF